jgi:glycosyltransferase involved in cell wall biosynthesis
MRACVIIPAFEAAQTVGDVVRSVLEIWPVRDAVLVVDDGSQDGTSEVARKAGARVLIHPRNRGKGAALRTGMASARVAGFDACVTVDADGQHPASEALKMLVAEPDAGALVLGVRDLKGAGAPRANQMSNEISNFFLSLFIRRRLDDTQCGLRRYPLSSSLDLDARDDGYAFEAEVILRAAAYGVRIVEVPVRVVYPPEHERVTHFDTVRDPARIVARVVKTLVLTRVRGLERGSPARDAVTRGVIRDAFAGSAARDASAGGSASDADRGSPSPPGGAAV